MEFWAVSHLNFGLLEKNLEFSEQTRSCFDNVYSNSSGILIFRNGHRRVLCCAALLLLSYTFSYRMNSGRIGRVTGERSSRINHKGNHQMFHIKAIPRNSSHYHLVCWYWVALIEFNVFLLCLPEQNKHIKLGF